ncbi:hypothetical protein D3C71_2033750 [compost metagenome]
MRHRHLAGIRTTMEHGFPEKGPTNGEPIKPTHQVLPIPDFHRMRHPAPEQFAIHSADGAIDPGGLAICPNSGAAFDDAIPIGIDANVPTRRPHSLLEAL